MNTLAKAVAETLLVHGCHLELQRSRLGEVAVFVKANDSQGGLHGVLRFYGPSQSYSAEDDTLREQYLDAIQTSLVAAGVPVTWPKPEQKET